MFCSAGAGGAPALSGTAARLALRPDDAPVSCGRRKISCLRMHFVLDRTRDDVLKCKYYVMGWCARSAPTISFSGGRRQGSAKRSARRQLHYPRTFDCHPGRRLDAAGVDPKARRGGNQPAPACPRPARLRPAVTGRHWPCAPQVLPGADPWSNAALALDQAKQSLLEDVTFGESAGSGRAPKQLPQRDQALPSSPLFGPYAAATGKLQKKYLTAVRRIG